MGQTTGGQLLAIRNYVSRTIAFAWRFCQGLLFPLIALKRTSLKSTNAFQRLNSGLHAAQWWMAVAVVVVVQTEVSLP